MYGKVIDGGSRRRPEPYPTTRSRSSKTSETGKSSEDNRAKNSHRGRVVITILDDSESEHEINSVTDDNESENEINIVSDDNESDLDYQPDEDYGPVDDGRDLDDAANEDIWPEQFPAEVDLMKLKRYCKQSEPFQLAEERLTEKRRTQLYGTSSLVHILVAWRYIDPKERHTWLPDAFGRSRGRPYEKTCDRVWTSWWSYEHDMFARAIPSVEASNSKCPTPMTLNFPKRRYRHARPGQSSDASSSPGASNSSPAASSAVPSSRLIPARRPRLTTSHLINVGLSHPDPVKNRLSKDLKTSLLVGFGELHLKTISQKGEKQLRMDCVEALRRIKDEKDKVLVGLEKALRKLLNSKSIWW